VERDLAHRLSARDTSQQLLTDCGLLSSLEVEAALKTVAPDQGPQTLAENLVRQGRLTAYQANELRNGRAKGLVLGEYEVLERLGAGGMGIVVKARHRRMNRLVALKMISPLCLGSQGALRRFNQEVQAVALLHHPNVVTAYDAGEADGI